MGPKTSVETCFMANLPLKNSILKSETLKKGKGKKLNPESAEAFIWAFP